MAARADEASDASFLLLQSYARMTPEQRAAWVRQWLALIEGEAREAAASSLPSTSQPGPPRCLCGSRPLLSALLPLPFFLGLSKGIPLVYCPGPDLPSVSLPRDVALMIRSGNSEALMPRHQQDWSGWTLPQCATCSTCFPGGMRTIPTWSQSLRLYRARNARSLPPSGVAGGNAGRKGTPQRHRGGAGRRNRQCPRYLVRTAIHSRTLKPGARIAVSGKPEVFRGQPVFNSPAAYPADSEAAAVHTGRLAPVYPLTEGLRLPALRNLTWQALQGWLGGVEETLPDTLREGRMPLLEAIFQAHYPDSMEAWQAARSRLAFDELLTLQLAMQSRRRDSQVEVHGVAVNPKADVAGRFLRSLPFELTGAQAGASQKSLMIWPGNRLQ